MPVEWAPRLGEAEPKEARFHPFSRDAAETEAAVYKTLQDEHTQM